MCSFQKLRIFHKCERSTTKDSCPASSVILSTFLRRRSLSLFSRIPCCEILFKLSSLCCSLVHYLSSHIPTSVFYLPQPWNSSAIQ